MVFCSLRITFIKIIRNDDVLDSGEYYYYYFFYFFLPSVSIPEGGLKIDENKLKGYDAQSTQSGSGRLSCSRTALKRCTSTETR